MEIGYFDSCPLLNGLHMAHADFFGALNRRWVSLLFAIPRRTPYVQADMKLTFIGIGGAFDIDNFNSNMVIEMEPQELIQMNRKDTIPRRLMIDCGFTAPFALREAGIDPLTISGLYVSHQHSDHIGGTEYYAFKTYFSPHGVKPKIIASAELLEKLWNDSLRGGLGSLQGKIANMNTSWTAPMIRGQCPLTSPHCHQKNFKSGTCIASPDTRTTV